MKLLPWLAVTIPACPLLVEVFPDPTDVPDQDGEFVEVRLDATFRADTLTLLMDGKAAVRVPYPEGNRLVLVHDSAFCPVRENVACAVFKESLPNSRESLWKLEAGTCTDSVLVPASKAGKAYQRRSETCSSTLPRAVNPNPNRPETASVSSRPDCATPAIRSSQPA